MKKLISVLILAVFFISLATLTVSEEENIENRETTGVKKNTIKEEIAKAIEFAEIKREKLQKSPILNEEQLEKFRILETETLRKLMKLNEGKLLGLTELKKDQIKKLAKLEISNLRKITSLNKETIAKITELEEEQLVKLSSLDRARLKKLSGLSKDSLNGELKKIEIEKIDPKILFKKRIISQQKIKKSEERFQIAKQKLLDSKKKLDAERRLLKLAKEKNDEEFIKEHARNYLSHAADAIINHLEKIKNKIQQSYNIGSEEALEIIRDINLKIKDLEDAKSDAEGATEKEEIRKAARTINAAWKRTRIQSEFYVNMLINKKIEEIIKRSEQLEKKLEDILTSMEEKNLDVQKIEEKLTSFSERIDEARTQFQKSMQKFREAKSTGVKVDIEKLIIGAKSFEKEARAALKESHNTLTEIIKDIRVLDKTINFEKERAEEQIIIVGRGEQTQVDVEIEGFLKTSHQKLINSLAKNLNQTKTNADIEIEVKIEGESLELKKEIKGTLTESQKNMVNKLANSLEDIDDKVKIKISSGEVAQ